MQMSGLCAAVADLRPRSNKFELKFVHHIAVLIVQRGKEEEEEEKEENESKKENFSAYSSVRFEPHPLAAQASLVW